MFNAPLTFLFDFNYVTDKMRPCIMQEFAAGGAKHLVLSDFFMGKLLADPDLADTLQQEMSDAGLSFCDAHAPFGLVHDLLCPMTAQRPMMIARQKLILEICAYLDVRTVTIHIGSTRLAPASELSPEVHFQRSCEALAELLPVAEKNNIIISIENTWYPSSTPDMLCRIKQQFPSPALGFCYDAGHANIMDNGRHFPAGRAWDAWKTCGCDGLPPWENDALEKMLPHLVVCHLHDNNGQADAHDLPEKGSVNWARILPEINKAPRLKAIQSEVIPCLNRIRIADLTAKFKELEKLV